MMEKLRIAIVSGTNRQGAYSLMLAKGLLKLPELANVDAQLMDLAQLPAEVYLPTSYYTKPEGFAFWQNTLDHSDGVIFRVPEYNASIPGILKHFIDVLKYPGSFPNKPVALVGLTSGASKESGALAAMTLLMKFLKADVFEKQVFIRQCKEVVSEDSEIRDSNTQALLSEQLNGFVKKCQRNQLTVHS